MATRAEKILEKAARISQGHIALTSTMRSLSETKKLMEQTARISHGRVAVTSTHAFVAEERFP